MNVLFCDRCRKGNLDDKMIIRHVVVGIRRDAGNEALWNLDLCPDCDKRMVGMLRRFSKPIAENFQRVREHKDPIVAVKYHSGPDSKPPVKKKVKR